MHKNLFAIILYGFTCSFILSCKSPQGIFGKKSSYEKYADQLKSAGLAESALAIAWVSAAGKTLQKPLAVSIPYKETGFFPAELPSGAGYIFRANQGDRIIISLLLQPQGQYKFFSELIYKHSQEKTTLLHTADTLLSMLQLNADNSGEYILRLQPELLTAVSYTLTIETGPSLGFPVGGLNTSYIGSFWGVNRDGGRRSHEGIDIFAKKLTPAVAAANGRISHVTENNLGGKVVFMQPDDRSISLYYAHLDSQLVSPGQRVKQGEIVGLVGNTGNAKTTAAHLHFGIYTSAGAIDPLPFVNTNRTAPKKITSDTSLINTTASVKTSVKGIKVQQWVKLLAATDYGFRVQDWEENQYVLPVSGLSFFPLRKIKLSQPSALRAVPLDNSAIITIMEKSTELPVYGIQYDYQFVNNGQYKGWIKP